MYGLFGLACRKQQKAGKAREKTNARQLSQTGINLIDPGDEECEMLGEHWKDLWQPSCRAKRKLGSAPRRWLRSRKLHPERFPKRSMAVWWNLRNPQSNEWNLLSSQNMKIALQAKVSLDDPLQCGAQVYFNASSDENSRCERCSEQSMGEAPEVARMATGHSVRQKDDMHNVVLYRMNWQITQHNCGLEIINISQLHKTCSWPCFPTLCAFEKKHQGPWPTLMPIGTDD